MNIKYVISLLALALVSACGTKNSQISGADINDFDKLCTKLIELSKNSEFPDLSPEERAKRLDSSLSEEISTSSDAYIAWSAIRNAAPSQRASLYKDAAASTGNEEWECPVIDKLGDQVGSN
ncbi:hypothetical protein [Microbulbifer elongatus]|uniref:hypothetical protein n=1 Tax=Microbulbifer elongatus TaxID=86173 RepID=UPI001CFCB52A|nr:hypothetical protein [Microbulbifer elongatus]